MYAWTAVDAVTALKRLLDDCVFLVEDEPLVPPNPHRSWRHDSWHCTDAFGKVNVFLTERQQVRRRECPDRGAGYSPGAVFRKFSGEL